MTLLHKKSTSHGLLLQLKKFRFNVGLVLFAEAHGFFPIFGAVGWCTKKKKVPETETVNIPHKDPEESPRNGWIWGGYGGFKTCKSSRAPKMALLKTAKKIRYKHGGFLSSRRIYRKRHGPIATPLRRAKSQFSIPSVNAYS